MAKVGVADAFEGRGVPKKLEAYREAFKADQETKVIHIRLHEQRAALLKELFRAQGLDMTSGIRTLVYDWLAKNM